MSSAQLKFLVGFSMMDFSTFLAHIKRNWLLTLLSDYFNHTAFYAFTRSNLNFSELLLLLSRRCRRRCLINVDKKSVRMHSFGFEQRYDICLDRKKRLALEFLLYFVADNAITTSPTSALPLRLSTLEKFNLTCLVCSFSRFMELTVFSSKLPAAALFKNIPKHHYQAFTLLKDGRRKMKKAK